MSISQEEVKKFIMMVVNNDIIAPESSSEMMEAVSSYLVNQIKVLTQKTDEVKLPGSWSNATLIKRAYELTEYRGLLTIANQEGNTFDFNRNYLDFSRKIKIGNFINNGNVFIQYIHVVKLFRQIRDLNEAGKSSPGFEVKRLEKLKNCYDEMQLVGKQLELERAKNEENAFWVTALESLAIHALASVHYIDENGNLYDLEKSKKLLINVEYLCEQGNQHIKATDEELIGFYTLYGTLIPTLPYKSFDQQKNDISTLEFFNTPQLCSM